jgi:4-hydroxythreonine-4-phosphate dehydrogenase
MSNGEYPVIALTMGEPAGVGPEILAKYVAGIKKSNFTLVVVGDQRLLHDAEAKFKLKVPNLKITSRPSREKFAPNDVNFISLKLVNPKDVTPGRPTAKTGRAAMAFVEKATDLVMLNQVDAIVTGPISKKAINAAGYYFSGHTDYLAHRTNTSKFAMCFVNGPIRVALVTAHCALRKVHSKVKLARIARTVSLFNEFLISIGVKKPRIVVTGLNPHAGEQGLLGTEELAEIKPAVETCRTQGINLDGPVSAEAAFVSHISKKYDGVVAMYHDQGMIPVKLLDFEGAVNVTIGIPIIRTSPAHGTAFDISGQNRANPASMKAAITTAIKMAKTKKNLECRIEN